MKSKCAGDGMCVDPKCAKHGMEPWNRQESPTYVKLIDCGTHSLLMLYDRVEGFAIASAVSEISKGSYPYQRTWEGETCAQYDKRQEEIWGPDPMGDWHGRNE